MVKILRPVTVVVFAFLLVAGCGGDSGSGNGNGSGGVDLEPGQLESVDVNNCSLLTKEEVTEYAGEELVSDEDSPLGCGWTEPGEVVAQFIVKSYRGGGDSDAAAKALIESPEQIIKLTGVGDDAVAVSTHGEVINWVIARKGNLFVVLNPGFLLFEPTPAELERAGKLAAKALDRLVDAA